MDTRRLVLVLVLFGFCVGFLVGFASAFDATFYDNSTTLSDVYTLHWKVEGDEIYLALEVETTGWVGFGIAEPTSGSMPGADMLTGWIDSDGVAHIQDRHAVEKAYPLADQCNNWILRNGEEANGYTIIEVRRKLDTGDIQDRPIPEGRTRIVWAFGLYDIFAYHESNRKATSVVFYGVDTTPTIPISPDIKSADFLNNFTVPAVETYYHDVFWPLPTVPEDVHIVALDVLLDPVTKDLVHHFALKGCLTLDGDCSYIWGWAPGMGPLVTPPEAGFRAGPSDGSFKALNMQTHYNNVDLVPDMVDHSGIRIYYTKNLRQYDAGVIELGDTGVRNPGGIPAGTGTYEVEYDCPSECTTLMGNPVNIFASFFHMHQIGHQIWATHWRNGEMIGEINRIDFWDFGFQQNTPVNVVIEPGDRINTHCVFKRGSQFVPFGQASDEEMCTHLLSYWPKVPGTKTKCSYSYSAAEQKNFTMCGSGVLEINGETLPNPSIPDPPGGHIIQFGQIDASYVCPSSSTAPEPSTETSPGSTSPGSTSPGSTVTSSDSGTVSSSGTSSTKEDDEMLDSSAAFTIPSLVVLLVSLCF